MVKRGKVVAMLSGGLDGILAAKMMFDQGLEVVGLSFVSPFFEGGDKGKGRGNLAVEMGRQIGIEVIVRNVDHDFFDMLRNPASGYGSAINPCIDCKIYMLSKGRELMEEIGAQAIVTGEVLGQRPMSQRRDAMMKIERESGLRGKLLRPLSAHYLPETDIEKEGIVDRDKLLDITGRGRTIQLEMAAEIGLEGISCGTGGCLLTDKNMKDKMLDLFAYSDEITVEGVTKLKVGRHFRLDHGLKFIIGRNQQENEFLLASRQEGEIVVEPVTFSGGTALIENHPEDVAHIAYIANIIRSFSKFPDGDDFSVELFDDCGSRAAEIEFLEVDYQDFWIGQPKPGE